MIMKAPEHDYDSDDDQNDDSNDEKTFTYEDLEKAFEQGKECKTGESYSQYLKN